MRPGLIGPRVITPVRRSRSSSGHARCGARARPLRDRRAERRESRGIGRPQAGGINCRPGPIASSQRSAEEGSDRRRSPLGSATGAPRLLGSSAWPIRKRREPRRVCKRFSLCNDLAGTTATRRTLGPRRSAGRPFGGDLRGGLSGLLALGGLPALWRLLAHDGTPNEYCPFGDGESL